MVDAMGRVHRHRAHILALKSPEPRRTMFGPAATIAFMPYRDDVPQANLGFGELFYEALGQQPIGQVLVLSSGGYPDVSHGGGTKLGRVEYHRLAGVLADGRLRDFEQLRSYDFATWCRGEATRWGGDTVMPYAANIAVEIDGVTVTPGDLVYADVAGAVVIPADSLSRVLDEADTVEREDVEAAARIRDERWAGKPANT
ncbi:RraA family protein [Nocardia brevicatena]|uniref:RraA family protein n=1 Tax=Nocardia brevicatena TaxID=37327 RepID=UPI001C3F40B5|nr:RraA family protein [Nocardia brevicatena]